MNKIQIQALTTENFKVFGDVVSSAGSDFFYINEKHRFSNVIFSYFPRYVAFKSSYNWNLLSDLDAVFIFVNPNERH